MTHAVATGVDKIDVMASLGWLKSGDDAGADLLGASSGVAVGTGGVETDGW